MKYYISLTCFIPIYISGVLFASEPIQSLAENVEDAEHLAQEGYALIDALFDNACASIAAKEDLMNAQWLGKQDEIKKLRNLLSDATIMFIFDHNTENPIPQLLSAYVENKIAEKVPVVFNTDKISIKRVKDFYRFSHIMCELSGGTSCGRMMRTLKSDNFERVLLLKAQKSAREQLRKEDAHKLRDILIFGTRN